MNAPTCWYLMINFKLMKIFIFLCFHERINSKLNLFSSISKNSNFRVLQLRSFPCPNNFTLELKSNTLSPGLNSFFSIFCHAIVCPLFVEFYIMICLFSPFLYLRELHLSFLPSCFKVHVPPFYGPIPTR